MPELDAVASMDPAKDRPIGTTRLLTAQARALLTDVHQRFEAERQALLAARRGRRRRLAHHPAWPMEPAEIRAADWTVAAVPGPLLDRRVEITGPVDRKMMINALNSGARIFMADFEDSHSPVWSKTLAGHNNIMDAVRGQLTLTTDEKEYSVGPDPALLVVRVRGLHLPEPHARIDGQPMSAAFFDAALCLFHNAKEQLAQGTGPYLYLPKLEGYQEARLWEQVLRHIEDALDIPAGSVKVTVLVETLPAAFEMEEIVYELRSRLVALNAGRWDYIFSCIKVFAEDGARTLPDRAQVTMEAPFMQAYAARLVDVCHRRGALAMGGMSAFIPNRRDAEVTARALDAVRADKEREVAAGFDGTWVAHPDLVPVAMAVFDAGLGTAPNQVRKTPHVQVDPHDLVDFTIPDGRVTMAGIETNVEVSLRYLSAWLSGTGAVAIHDLMEDAATAEISRSQLWHWRYHSVRPNDGQRVDAAILRTIIAQQAHALRDEQPDAPVEQAAQLLEKAVLAWPLPDFITLPALATLSELNP